MFFMCLVVWCGSENRTLIDLFGLGRTVKHRFDGSLLTTKLLTSSEKKKDYNFWMKFLNFGHSVCAAGKNQLFA